jgi:hypothetical protein
MLQWRETQLCPKTGAKVVQTPSTAAGLAKSFSFDSYRLNFLSHLTLFYLWKKTLLKHSSEDEAAKKIIEAKKVVYYYFIVICVFIFLF